MPSWWSEIGRPGYVPSGWMGEGWPWTFAGHVLGAWSLDEPGRAPAGLPFPGVLQMQTPLVWYDSVSVTIGDNAAWRGFDATLGEAVGQGRPTGRGGRTVLDLRSGDYVYDDNALSIGRSDSTVWLRGEAVSGSRGPVEALSAMGRHQWGAAAGWHRRRHAFEATYAQRGAASLLASGFEQAANGESGSLEYRYRRDRLSLALRGERGRDRHEGVGALPFSVREVGESRAIAEAFFQPGRDTWGLELRYTKTRAERRPLADPEGQNAFLRGGQTAWAAARWERPIGDGDLRIDVGAGRHGPLDATEWAPSAQYRFRAGALGARVGVERLLAPAWFDLAPEEAPFMQRTWAGVIEVDKSGGSRHARAGFLVGRTQDRAVAHRLPLEEMWLALGLSRDPSRYDFAMLTLSGEWVGSRLGVGGEGFALARDRTDAQPNVDPGFGARSWAEWRRSFFQGDLGVVLRGEADAIGARESEGGIAELGGDPDQNSPRFLPAYMTFGATAAFTLARAIVTLRVRNLENQRRAEPWIDDVTLTEARGPGREIRFALTARLAN